MIFLCNATSESMMTDPRVKEIHEPLTEAQFIHIIHNQKVKSALGHKPIAQLLSRITGKQIEVNRCGLNLKYDDIILLVILDGRLPEKPEYIENRGKINYSLVRYEKQTLEDIQKSNEIIKELEEI